MTTTLNAAAIVDREFAAVNTGAPTMTALDLAIAEARARLDAALVDLEALGGVITDDERDALAADTVAGHLEHLAALERDPQAALGHERWGRLEHEAARRTRERARRRRRAAIARWERDARQSACVVRARCDAVDARWLIDDAEALDVRAELAAAGLM